MKKKSLVEQMNSWKPFLDEINGSLKAKDFRKKTIIQALSTLDPDATSLTASFFRSCFGLLVGPGFFIGREALYGEIFDTFLAKNKSLFKRSPLIVIQTFNTFVKTLFVHPEHRLLDESLARKTLTKEEKILKKAAISKKRLTAYIESLGKKTPQKKEEEEVVEEEEEEISELGFEKRESLFSDMSPIDEKTRQFFEDVLETEGTVDAFCIAALEEKYSSFSHFIHTVPSTFPSSRYGPFLDLKAQIEALPQSLSFTEEELKTLLKRSPEEREKILTHKVAAAKEPFEAIIKKAVDLNNLIEKINLDIADLKTILAPFLKKVDTKSRVEILLSELNLLEITKNMLEKRAEDLKAELELRKEKVEKLKKSFETEFRDLLIYIRNLEFQLDEARWSIVFSRIEIFSKKQPYPDLSNLVDDVRSDLIALLKKCGEDVIIGKKNIRDIIKEMLDASYAHNVKLIRKETMGRSLRLKDIREEVEKELHDLDCSLSLMKRETISQDILSKRTWLFNFFTKLSSPFLIFKDTYDPASINTLFRYFWTDLDRWRQTKVKNEFIEKKEPCSLPLTHIAQLPYAEREHKLLLLKTLEEKKKNIISCARAIQAVKTFEPERIDSLLEALTLLQFPEDIFTPVDSWLKTTQNILEKIEEEVFCEASFLDERGRLEPGFAINELKATLSPHLATMTSYVETCFKNIEEQSSDSFTQHAASFFREELKIESGDFFETCKKIGKHILYRRLLLDTNPRASKAMLLPPIINRFLIKKAGDAHIDELISYSRGLFDIFYSTQDPTEKIIGFLQEFSKRAQALYGEDSIVKVCFLLQNELKSKTFETPVLSFVPGDLSFFRNTV